MSAKVLWIALAILCAAGTWLYAYRVLIPEQIAYAAAHGLPRGNFSDLYPRWVGARELLLRGRDPYSAEVRREIQMGFYGRVLPPDPGQKENYQQGFYHPVYIAFLLAPTLKLPFESVQRGFFWLLLGLTVVGVLLWLRLLRWRLPLWEQAVMIILTLGSLPVMQGLKLQQMTLLVIPLIAAALVLLAGDRPVSAGILLALATIKPQLVLFVLYWLTLWTMADWRRRYRWAVSFLLSLAILCAGSEYYLPHWILRFWRSIHEYRSYTGEMASTAVLIGGWSRAVELLAFALMTAICWRERRPGASSEAFALAASLVLAMTVLLVPSYGPYNQALLIPALLMVLKEGRAMWGRSFVNRGLLITTICLVGWPWLACASLAGLSFVLPPETVERGWASAFWTTLLIPVAVAAAMLVCAWQRSFAASNRAATS